MGGTESFEKVLKLFIPQISEEVRCSTTNTTCKTLNESYKKLVSDHRPALRENQSTSGIFEVRGEREGFLDDIVLTRNEREEERKTEMEGMT